MLELTFPHGRKYLDDSMAYLPTEPKVYKVFICMPAEGTEIYNKFEGSSYVVRSQGKDVVISGTAGEMWCSPTDKVIVKYRMVNGESLSEFIKNSAGNGFIFDWLEVEVVPGAVKNFALHIPIYEQFSINTAWGASLDINHPRCQHAEGDFIVCAVDPNGRPNLRDRWVLNGEVFKRTYTMSGKLAELNKGSHKVVVAPKPESLV